MLEIVHDSIDSNVENEKICLHFTPDAEQRWIKFYNDVESEMGLLGNLSDFKDYASKVAENMARIAALLHYFNGDKDNISLAATNTAVKITLWFVNEYVRLFSKPQELTLLGSDADELYWWIKEYCVKCFVPYIRKTTILQYGPNRFRNRSKLNELLSTLYSQNRIYTEKRGKALFIKPIDSLTL